MFSGPQAEVPGHALGPRLIASSPLQQRAPIEAHPPVRHPRQPDRLENLAGRREHLDVEHGHHHESVGAHLDRQRVHELSRPLGRPAEPPLDGAITKHGDLKEVPQEQGIAAVRERRDVLDEGVRHRVGQRQPLHARRHRVPRRHRERRGPGGARAPSAKAPVPRRRRHCAFGTHGMARFRFRMATADVRPVQGLGRTPSARSRPRNSRDSGRDAPSAVPRQGLLEPHA